MSRSVFNRMLIAPIAILILMWTVQVSAIAGDTTRISVATDGLQGNMASDHPNLSPNGRYAVFFSQASNLVSDDVNDTGDIFLRDIQQGTTTLVPVVINNANFVGYPDVSNDGRYITYISINKDFSGFWNIFRYDRQSGTTSLVSSGLNGTQANNGSFTPVISADGRYIAFTSYASNLVAGDTNGSFDVFLYDNQKGTITLVSVDSNGAHAINTNPHNSNADSRSPSISDDGRFIVFESNATNLVANDTNAAPDIFLRDMKNGITSRVSVSSAGAQGNDGSWNPTISSNGHFAVFSSASSNLVTGDTNGAQDVFLRDLEKNSTSRVSVDSGGVQGNSVSDSPSVTNNGQFVVFCSNANNLTTRDDNGYYDIFLYNTKNKITTLVSSTPNGTSGNGPSFCWQRPIQMSSDGKYIAYLSYASDLVDGDTNGFADVFLYENNITQQNMDTKSSVLPDTGFAPNRITVLSTNLVSKAYSDESMWLIIPSLGLKQRIMGVPSQDGQWDITWLGNDIGWLNGTAFPTWNGNSVLTGHVYNSNGKPGPFVDLESIKWDEEIIIQGWGQEYIYKVRSVSKWTNPQDVNILTKHEDLPWLSLITCRSYDEKSNKYRYRVVVRAVLVKIQ